MPRKTEESFMRTMRGPRLSHRGLGMLLSWSVLAGLPSSSALDSDCLAPCVDLRPAFEKWGLAPRVQGRRNTCSVLTQRWPVCGGFRWPKNVQWKNEVLEMPPPEGVFDGHSVLIVGYRDGPEHPGGGVFLFRNSNNNGRDGSMTYAYARAYMNDAVWIDHEADDRRPYTLPFELSEDGRFAVRLTAARGPRHGVYHVDLDRKRVLTADLGALEEGEADLALGTHELKRGSHRIAFRATENAKQVGLLGVEILRLLRLPPEARRNERTHHEAHFIRLGIGRAIYAYRLAFDTLPDSLETLVKKRFMPPRYLRDENNLPLKVWREGDTMVVESPGEDRWKHSWKGLDARR